MGIYTLKFMHIENIREYCLAKSKVTESMPFGDETLVYKVMDKMFLLMNLEGELRINIKCDPEEAIRLRETHQAVLPGYHMSKKHWNTVIIDGTIPGELILKWIDKSYNLVVSGLPKSVQKSINR
jgi:predicted DNA-binding protein (MmcQ/YjbR family)